MCHKYKNTTFYYTTKVPQIEIYYTKIAVYPNKNAATERRRQENLASISKSDNDSSCTM